MRLLCFSCKEQVRMTDRIFLDEMNTITHQKCYSSKNIFTVKDRGTFREIIERNNFFDDLKPHLFVVDRDQF